jgi:hypothetical protein
MKMFSEKSNKFIAWWAIGGVVFAAILFGAYLWSNKSEPKGIFGKKLVSDGRPVWFIHGLIDSDDYKIAQQDIDPFKIKLVASGCILGGEKYEKELKSNHAMYAAAPDELKILLRQLRPFN